MSVASDPPNVIDFQYDRERDIVIARPRWHIRTAADCERWCEEWVAYLTKFGRKIDCVMLLDEFKVDPKVAAKWGEYRAKINNELIRNSFRVNTDWAVRVFVLTSGTRYSAATGEAASLEEAIQGLLDLRK